MTSDLFLALLAHDAYNRGYDPDLPATGNDSGLSMPNPIGSMLGNFKMFTTSSQEFAGADEEIGFYAIAYEAIEDGNGVSAGDIVISYRGTDPEGGAIIR